jgi:hypothetical protein
MERLLRCLMQGMQRRVRVIASLRDKVMIVELGWGMLVRGLLRYSSELLRR